MSGWYGAGLEATISLPAGIARRAVAGEANTPSAQTTIPDASRARCEAIETTLNRARVLLKARHIGARPGRVARLVAELVERRLQRRLVALARIGRATYGVDRSGLLREDVMSEDRNRVARDLARVRVAVLKLDCVDLHDLVLRDGN